ncbi:MAG: hypothetical protein ACRD2E_03680 [Terriglobales bacterium]
MEQAINPAETHGKRIAMVAWSTKPDGSDDVVVFTGICDWDGTRLKVVRQPPESSFVLQDDWLTRLRSVPGDLRDMLLSADYYFDVTIGPLEENYRGPLVGLGIKWPHE